MDVLDALLGSQIDTNAPHWADKRDAADIAVPPAPSTTDTGSDTDPNQRNLIAIAEDNYAEAIAPLAESDDWRDRIEGHLAAMQLMLSKEYQQTEEDTWVTLTASAETVLRRQGRRYLCIWTPTALSNIVFSVQGQLATLSLTAGWNNVSLPDGTTLVLASGGSASLVLIRLTNWFYGASI